MSAKALYGLLSANRLAISNSPESRSHLALLWRDHDCNSGLRVSSERGVFFLILGLKYHFWLHYDKIWESSRLFII